MTGKKLAYLVPVYNGGALLLETVQSPAKAGLPPDAYEVIVIDNQSTDGAPQLLPDHDWQGVPIRVFTNPKNLGRVGNWNRALEIAGERGFEFALFLMVGDVVHGAAAIELMALMQKTGSSLGMGFFHIVDKNLNFIREARRIRWNAPFGIKPKLLVQQSVAIGSQIIGILGGNIYRLGGGLLPRFDAENPKLTDHVGTWNFALQADDPIVYIDKPLFDWRRHSARSHMEMDLIESAERERQMIVTICHHAGVEPNWVKIKTSMFLRLAFHLFDGYTNNIKGDTFLRYWKWHGKMPGHISMIAMLRMVFLYRRHRYMFTPIRDEHPD